MAASNLTLRLATAAVMLPLLMALLFLGPAWGWLLFVMAAAAIGAFELFGMTYQNDRVAAACGVLLTWAVMLAVWFSPSHPRLTTTVILLLPALSILLALWRMTDIQSAGLRIAGATFGPVWLGGGLGAMTYLRVAGGDDGPAYVVLSLALAWLADTGGYFAGRAFGKRKLSPKVSPKKTVEGALGGATAAILGAVGAHFLILQSMPLRDAILVGALGSVLGIFGDLGESLLKRAVGVKDSGGIVPGHGGILDRVDALLITGPLTLLYVMWIRP